MSDASRMSEESAGEILTGGETERSKKIIRIKIKTHDGSKDVDVQVEEGSKVKQLREAVVKAYGLDVELSSVSLIFSGRMLEDDESLAGSGIRDGLTVHLHIKQQQQLGSADRSSAPTSDPALDVFNGLFRGFVGVDFSFFRSEDGTQSASMDEMLNRIQNNPELGMQYSNSPMGRFLLSNPQMVFDLIRNNPLMRAYAETNPMISFLLNNEEFTREMCELNRQDLTMPLPTDTSNAREAFEVFRDPIVQEAMTTHDPDLLRSIVMSNPEIRREWENDPFANRMLNNRECMRQAMHFIGNPTLMEENIRLQEIFFPAFQAPNTNGPSEQSNQHPTPTNNTTSNEDENSESSGQVGTEPISDPWATSSNNQLGTEDGSRTSNRPTTHRPIVTARSSDPVTDLLFGERGDQMFSELDPEVFPSFMTSFVRDMQQRLISDLQFLQMMTSDNPFFRNNPELLQLVQEMTLSLSQMMESQQAQHFFNDLQAVREAMQSRAESSRTSQDDSGLSPATTAPGTAASPGASAANKASAATTSSENRSREPRSSSMSGFENLMDETFRQMGGANSEGDVPEVEMMAQLISSRFTPHNTNRTSLRNSHGAVDSLAQLMRDMSMPHNNNPFGSSSAGGASSRVGATTTAGNDGTFVDDIRPTTSLHAASGVSGSRNASDGSGPRSTADGSVPIADGFVPIADDSGPRNAADGSGPRHAANDGH